MTGGTAADMKMGETDLRRITRLEEAFMMRLAKAPFTSQSQTQSLFNFLSLVLLVLVPLQLQRPFYSEAELKRKF